MIDRARLKQTFLDLLAFNSPHPHEREIIRYCADVLRGAGFVCQTDAAGNLIAQKSGAVTNAPRIFFNSHVDSVQPTAGLVVVEEDGILRTDGRTILSSDDKAGVAQILEAVQSLADAGTPHGDLQVVFTTGEEVGLVGAKALSPAVIAGSLGFILDSSGPPGAMVVSSPTQDTLTAHIRGQAAHAGVSPERGVSALQIAARAIDRMKLGRIDPETTANVGAIRGGTATNVVAEEAFVTLEARSRNLPALDEQVAHMRGCFAEAAADFGGTAQVTVRREYLGYTWGADELPIRIAAEAWRRCSGREVERRLTGGGSDANVFNGRGIPCVVLSVGYVDHHTFQERIPLADLYAGAEWAVAIAQVAAEPR